MRFAQVLIFGNGEQHLGLGSAEVGHTAVVKDRGGGEGAMARAVADVSAAGEASPSQADKSKSKTAKAASRVLDLMWVSLGRNGNGIFGCNYSVNFQIWVCRTVGL